MFSTLKLRHSIVEDHVELCFTEGSTKGSCDFRSSVANAARLTAKICSLICRFFDFDNLLSPVTAAQDRSSLSEAVRKRGGAEQSMMNFKG